MDTIALVEEQIADGERLLNRLCQESIPVVAAAWLKPVEDDRWSLCLVTPLVDKEGLAGAYREVYRHLRSLDNPWITDSDIRLVGERHPVAKDLLEILHRYPGVSPTRSRRPSLGGMPVEEVYLYPAVHEKPVQLTIYGLVFRNEQEGGPLQLSLEPHDPSSTLTVGSGGNVRKYPADTSMSWLVEAPPGSSPERGEHGLMELAWDLRGRRIRSSANEVWSLAKLGFHGFRFIRQPG
jgi:hypothetical protein